MSPMTPGAKKMRDQWCKHRMAEIGGLNICEMENDEKTKALNVALSADEDQVLTPV